MRYFLGMEVARSRKGISISQKKYTIDLLKETGMLGGIPSETPIEVNGKAKKKELGGPVDTVRYQRLVGRLIYLSHTRPNTAFVASVVSQYMQSPYEEHLAAIYQILRYLKMTPGKDLFFAKTEQRHIEAFTDAN